MAKRRRRRKSTRRDPRPPTTQVYRAGGEVCQLLTERTSRGRRRIVECKPAEVVEEVGLEDAFADVCKTNEVCGCGVPYDKFRSGWTFRDAAEMLGARGGAKFRPSRGRVLWMLSKLKRDEWEMHQKACAAGGEVEVDDLGPYPWEDADAEFAGIKGWR